MKPWQLYCIFALVLLAPNLPPRLRSGAAVVCLVIATMSAFAEVLK